jgi:hypothetical protein
MNNEEMRHLFVPLGSYSPLSLIRKEDRWIGEFCFGGVVLVVLMGFRDVLYRKAYFGKDSHGLIDLSVIWQCQKYC